LPTREKREEKDADEKRPNDRGKAGEITEVGEKRSQKHEGAGRRYYLWLGKFLSESALAKKRGTKRKSKA